MIGWEAVRYVARVMAVAGVGEERLRIPKRAILMEALHGPLQTKAVPENGDDDEFASRP